MNTNHWFFIKSLNVSINLNNVNQVVWEAKVMRQASDDKIVTQLVWFSGEVKTLSISDPYDRIRLRMELIGDNWHPEETV